MPERTVSEALRGEAERPEEKRGSGRSFGMRR